MKVFNQILFFSGFAIYADVTAMPAKKASSTVAATTTTRGASTVVMREVGGIAGNECLTY